MGGFAALLGGVLFMAFWVLLSRNFLEGSGLITKAGFMLVFLAIILCMGAGIIRLDQFRLWKRLLHSINNLEDIAKEADKLRENLTIDSAESEDVIQPAAHNLEMEAQEERAYSGYLSIYRKLKNGLLRYYLVLFIAAAVLGVGLYSDGAISLENGSVVTQFKALFENSGEWKEKVNQAGSDEYVVSVSSARLRAGAGTDYEVLNSYENGTEVTVTGKTQSDGSHIWYQVTTPDGTIGWMRDDTISKK